MSTVCICVPVFNPLLSPYTWSIVASKSFKTQPVGEPFFQAPPRIEARTPTLREKEDVDLLRPTLIPETSARPKKCLDYVRSAVISVTKFVCPENAHIIQYIPEMWMDFCELYRCSRYGVALWELVRRGLMFSIPWFLEMGYRIWKFVRRVIKIF